MLPSEKEILESFWGAPQIMVWMTNEQHQCIYCNQALLDYFGLPESEVAGLNWLKFIHPDDLERVQKNRQMLLESKGCRFFRQEFRGLTKTGQYEWILDICVPRFDAEGRFLGYTGSIIEITEQKNREEALRNQQKTLEKEILEISRRERARMGRDLHEGISQQLLGIGLKSILLERKLKRQGFPELEIAQEITSEINKAVANTRKISQSLFPVSLAKKNLAGALTELAEQARSLFGVNLVLDIHPANAALGPEKTLHLYQIVQEAITNSVRHGRAKNIKVSLQNESGGKNRLEIKDDGVGISKEASQSDGIGRHIMEYRARMIEGEIEIKRHPRGGTVVACRYA